MDGAEALQVVRDHQIDIAIVDFRMSPLDGVQFTQLVRQSPDSPDPFLPIIMLTGFAERHRVFEARDAGVTEIVVKPVTARSLLDRINTVIFKPRPFIRTEDYFGPCRRRRDDPAYDGPVAGATLETSGCWSSRSSWSFGRHLGPGLRRRRPRWATSLGRGDGPRTIPRAARGCALP
jgi:two-component system chemotaxis response regulator CheY